MAGTTSPVVGSDNIANAPEIAFLPDDTYVAAPTSNSALTQETGEESNNTGRSAWWKFTPARSGSVTIDTIGSSGDSVLHVYRADTIPATAANVRTAEMGYNDDNAGGSDASVPIVVESGKTYYIRVSSYNSAVQTYQMKAVAVWNGPPSGTSGLLEGNFYTTITLSDTGFDARPTLSGSINIGPTFTGNLGIKGFYEENLGIEVRLYDTTGKIYIATLENARGVQWQDEGNKAGTGTFEIPYLDPKRSLVTDRSIVKFYNRSSGREDYGIVITNKSATLTSDSQVWVKYENQPGIMNLLADAIVYPEYGVAKDGLGRYTIPANAPKERTFGFMSARPGPWFNRNEWVNPVGAVWTAFPGNKKNFPENLRIVDQKAQWIAVDSVTEDRAPGEIQYFVTDFTLRSAMSVQIYATGDNDVEVWLDGEKIIEPKKDEPLAWMVAQLKGLELEAGRHFLACKVRNATDNVKRAGQDLTGAIQKTPAGPSPIALIADVVYLSKVTGQPAQWEVKETLSAAVAFDSNKYKLKAAAINALNEMIKNMGGITNPKITVVGHASTEGAADDNYDLSVNRANAVKNYILSKKPAAIITATGKGETKPAYSPGTDPRNRRVEISYPRAELGVEPGDTWKANVIRRSEPTTWLATRTPQGWFRASVLKKLVTEAKSRNVLGAKVFNINYTDASGTDLIPWVNRGQFSFTTAQTNLYEIMQQLTEADFDCWVNAELMELRGSVRRGRDRTSGDDAVRLFVGKNLSELTVAQNAIKATNVVMRIPDGTFVEIRSANVDTYGRIEVGLQVGSVLEGQTAQDVANDLLAEQSKVQTTFTAQTAVLGGPTPYVDYHVGDTILVSALDGVIPARVMAITVDASNDIVKAYPELMYDPTSPASNTMPGLFGATSEPDHLPRRLPPSDAERQHVINTRMAGGSNMGSTRFAKPIDDSPLQSEDEVGAKVFFDSDRYDELGPPSSKPGDFWLGEGSSDPYYDDYYGDY